METVLRKQNRDGGWPYATGISWTEPTALAILACLAEGKHQEADRGIAWLRRVQRPDGGFPPQAAVEESTWVTSLVALLPAERLGERQHTRATDWLYRLTGQETSPVFRLRQFLLGNTAVISQTLHGWPWYPGTAAWVGPTVFGILALRRDYLRNRRPGTAERVDLGRRFLLSRTCAGGGWNHGASAALGHAARAYPETTGMALLALRGVSAPQIPESVAAASRFLSECRSADGQNWLRLGLMAHGSLPPDYRPAPFPLHTVRDAAVAVLADQAAAGRSSFL